jgi:hypothetical protein
VTASTTNATFYPIIADKTTGNTSSFTGTGLTFNPSTNILNTGIVAAATLTASTIGNTGAALTGATVTTTSTIVASGNIVGASGTNSASNVTGAVVVSGAGGVGVGGNIYVGNRMGYVWAANSVSSAYTVFNSTANSIDTIFG